MTLRLMTTVPTRMTLEPPPGPARAAPRPRRCKNNTLRLGPDGPLQQLELSNRDQKEAIMVIHKKVVKRTHDKTLSMH